MPKFDIYLLKITRKLYERFFGSPKTNLMMDRNANSVSKVIYDALTGEQPVMIARFGSTEMSAISNYVGVKQRNKKPLNYITGRTLRWWWEPQVILQMQQWSGFFPATVEKVEQFSKLMINDIPEVDILGSWLKEEEEIFKEELALSYKVEFELLNPYFSDKPWTWAMRGKKVLVVHPFAETIERQYVKRNLLFDNDLLPEFELKTIKAVQSIAGERTSFSDWFDALEYMKREIDKVDYDICLIGCGAYGFPLAAHVKRMGKKGVHLGGSLQLLFGIKGKRWEDVNYNSVYQYHKLINEYWVKPPDTDRPVNASTVEGACYW